MNFNTILRQFTKSFGSIIDSVHFIAKNNLNKYYIFPIILTIFLWLGGFALIAAAVDFISSYTHDLLQIEANPTDDGLFTSFSEFWETAKSWLNGASAVVMVIGLKIIFWLILGVVTKYILLIMLAPVLAYISEKTESIITGKSYPFDATQFTRDIWRGILIALRNVMIELGIVIVLAVITLFAPYLAPATAIIGFLVGAYFYGYSMIDYVSERRKMTIQESSQFVWQNMGMALGLGLLISLAMKVPVVGFLTASFISLVAAVSAVLLIYNKDYNSNKTAPINNGVRELKKEI